MRRLGPIAVGLTMAMLALIASAAAAAGSAVGTQRFLIVVSPQQPFAPQAEIVDASGRVIRAVGKGSGPGSAALSPNRKMAAWQEKAGIYVERVNGSRPRLLVRGGALFVWSPDSRTLLAGAAGGLATVSVATGVKQSFVKSKPHVTYVPLAWSGPAHAILYTTSAGVAGTASCCSELLILARPAGISERSLHRAVDAIHDSPRPSWSPNGRWIVFTTDGMDLTTHAARSSTLSRVRRHAYPTSTGTRHRPPGAPDSTRFAVGGYQQPVELISPRGGVLSSIRQTSLYPTAWTHAGVYLIPGGQDPRRLLVIRNGQRAAHTLFNLPGGEVLLSAQAF